MKKHLLVLFFASLIFASLSSCNKDDDGPMVDPIVGRWDAKKIRLTNFPQAYRNYEGLVIVPDVIGVYAIENNFKSDKTFTSDLYDVSGAVSEDKGTWSFQNGTYTLDFDQATTNVTLTLQNDDELLQVIENFVLPFEDANQNPVEVPCRATIVFKKR